MRGTAGLTIRRATKADQAAVHDVVLRAGLGSGRDPRALEYYRACPGGRLIVACRDDRIAGVSCAVSFGRTGWIGNVAVDPDCRGQGLGTAVSVAALDLLRAAGVTTVLLTATDLGRPIYEKLGFGYDGLHYGIWRRDPQTRAPENSDPEARDPKARVPEGRAPQTSAPEASEPEARAALGVGPGDGEQLVYADRAATGEDRGTFLRTLGGPIRVSHGDPGYRLALPWGSGPIVASSPAVGAALLADLARAEADPFLAFPEPNAAGAELAEGLGFRQVRRIPRMRFGPPVPGFRPERIFNVFSFAVG